MVTEQNPRDRAATASREEQQLDLGQATIPNAAVPAPADEAQELSLPAGLLEQFDEYRLLGKLGQGGMGAVYKALHTRLEKLVAIKVLPKERMQDRDAQSRFQREIKAVGRLNHPNLVQAYDAREIQGTTILVMEYVDGLDASALVRKLGPLPIADACELVRQAALGLQYAHQHDLVHRDVKPSNLMLNREGQVKVLDLGLARIRQDQANQQDLTSTGQMMGTADYIAPEQVRDSHSADIRADIYSLGCTLYHLLAGRTPFNGEKYGSAFDKMLAHVQESPPSVLEFRKDLPQPLVVLVERMLAKRPDERFAVPGEVAAALASFTSGCNLAALVSATESTPSTMIPVDTSMAATDAHLSQPSTGTHADGGQAADQAVCNKEPRLDSLLPPAGENGPSPAEACLATPTGPVPVDVGLATKGISPTALPDHPLSSYDRRRGDGRKTTAGGGVSGATVVAKPATTDAGSVGASSRRRPVLVALSLLGVLILAGVVFKLKTREGTLVVEVSQPDAEVQVLDDRGEIVVDLKSGDKPVTIGVDPGKHRIRVQKDGFELFTDEFTMKSAGREAIRATLQPSPVGQAFQPDGATNRQAGKPDLQPNRQPGKANLPGEGTPAPTSPRPGTPGRGVGGEGPASPTAPPLPINQFVPLAKSEQDLKAWQKTGSGTVTFENGGVRVENAAVTYPASAIDLVIRVKIKIEGDVPPSARLTLRETPAGFYAAMLEDGQKVTVGMTEGDKWRELKSAPVSVPRDKSLALQFSAVGDVLTVSLNGKPAVEVRDTTHRSGVPGLAAAKGATVFEDVEVKVLTRPSSTPGELASGAPHSRGPDLQSGQDSLKDRPRNERTRAASGNSPKNYELEFDGVRSYVETPVKYDGSHPITIEAWAMLRQDMGGPTHLLGNIHAGSGILLEKSPGDRLAFTVDGSPSHYILSADRCCAGKWQHLAGVWDGQQCRFFLNGLPQREVQGAPPSVRGSTRCFVIGCSSPLDSDPRMYFWPGWIHEIRISKVARYTEDFTPQQRFDADESTIALYHFDEGSGNIAHDASKNGNHAKIHGARWVEASDVKNRLPGLVVGTPRLPDGRRWQLETISPCWPGGLDWSPDGKWISCARDSVIRIHDAKTLAPVRFHVGHDGRVNNTKFSPGGKWLASCSEDCTVRLWNVGTGKAGPVLRGHLARVADFAWSPDSDRLASGTGWGDGKIRVWKVDGTLETSWPWFGTYNLLSWSGNGKWIAASGKASVKVWTPAGESVAELKTDGVDVSNCSFSPDGRWLATSIHPTKEGTSPYLALWSTDTWQIAKRSPERTIVHWPNEFAWSPDSKRLCSIWQCAWLLLWDIEKDRWLDLGGVQGFSSLACDPGFSEVLVNQQDRLLRFDDLNTGKTTRQFGFSALNRIRVAIQLTDGRVALCRDDLRLLSPEGCQASAKQGLPWTSHAIWSPDGRWLAVAGDDCTIRLWTPDGEPGPVFEGHTDAIQTITWHPKSQQLLTGSKDGTMRIWEVSGEGRVLVELEKGAAVDRLDWSPQAEQLLVQWTDATKKVHVSLFSAEGQALRELPTTDAPNELAWDATGKLVAGVFWNTGYVRIWNAETAETVLDFTEEGFKPRWLSWSPDGQWLAVTPGGEDRQSLARLWKRDGTPGPTIPAGPDSQVVWLDPQGTLAICDAEWVDVYKPTGSGVFFGQRLDLAAKPLPEKDSRPPDSSQLELVRSTRFPSRPWTRVFDAPRKRLYSWETGAIQALDLSTGEPLFTVLPLDKGRTVRIDPTGQMDTQDPEVEKEFIYYVAEPDGSTTLHTPAEFRKLMGWK